MAEITITVNDAEIVDHDSAILAYENSICNDCSSRVCDSCEHNIKKG